MLDDGIDRLLLDFSKVEYIGRDSIGLMSHDFCIFEVHSRGRSTSDPPPATSPC